MLSPIITYKNRLGEKRTELLYSNQHVLYCPTKNRVLLTVCVFGSDQQSYVHFTKLFLQQAYSHVATK